jgi:hypothetical protein
MIAKQIILLSFVLIFLSCALASGQQAGEPQGPMPAGVSGEFKGAREWLTKNNLVVTVSPKDAFSNTYIVVTGEGFPAEGAATKGQKRITAERAATVVAYRQLAEMIDGVPITGETVVKNASLQFDLINAAVKGFIRGAQVIYKEYNEQEEVALVMVKVGMTGPNGLGTMMYEKIMGNPNTKKALMEERPMFKAVPVSTAAAVPVETVAPRVIPGKMQHDGLIIDATTENFRPALINRIFSMKGEVLYDPSRVDQKVLVEHGCGEYNNQVEKARGALSKRGVMNPLVVKANGTLNPADLKVSDEDAVTIFSANQKSSFFSQAKVAFVVK